MLTLQTFISPNKWFSLEYPRMWELEVIDNIPAFFNPIEGKGALQVFSVQLGSTRRLDKELEPFDFLKEGEISGKMRAFLKNQNIIPTVESLHTYERDSMSFIPYEYNAEDRFYMACMFQKQNLLLLALYNCLGKPSSEEANIVGKIVRSINIS